jgi:virginiamycin B lyase
MAQTPGPDGRARLWRALMASSLAFALMLAVAPAASATTLTNTWAAKIGTAGANGSATLNLYLTGTGSLAFKVVKLRASTSLAVALVKTSCTGPTLLTLASVKTSSTGAAARTSSLTAAQSNSIKAATRGTGKIAIKIGTGTAAKCGVFAAKTVPAYLATSISVGPYPQGVTIGPTGVWVSNYYNGTLARVDPTTNGVLSSLQAGADTENVAPARLIFAEGSLWVDVDEYDQTGATLLGVSVRRIDPTSGAFVATIRAGSSIGDLVTSPGAIWVSSFKDGTVSRIDTTTNQVVATVTLAAGVFGLAYGEGSVWAANETTGSVSRIDPATNAVIATIATVGLPEGVAVGGGAIWVTNFGTTNLADGLLSRIDPLTNQVTQTIPVGRNPVWVTYAGGSLWVALYTEATLVRVNPITKAVQARVASSKPAATWPSGSQFGLVGVAATDHNVWAIQGFPAADANSAPPAGLLLKVIY